MFTDKVKSVYQKEGSDYSTGQPIHTICNLGHIAKQIAAASAQVSKQSIYTMRVLIGFVFWLQAHCEAHDYFFPCYHFLYYLDLK